MAIDPKILAIAQQVESKRPKTVIQHIIKHGYITTEELKNLYEYNHPPRAVRDVREQGIPIETYRIKGSDGKTIAAYRFGNPEEIEAHKLGGRKTFSKRFKHILVERYGNKCAITHEKYEERYLQIDHRVPYEVAGDQISTENSPENFMLLSGEAQRQKSWSCENCKNFKEIKDVTICKTCYWAYPENYLHIALQEEKRVEIVWRDKEIELYEDLANKAREAGIDTQNFIKKLLSQKDQ